MMDRTFTSTSFLTTRRSVAVPSYSAGLTTVGPWFPSLDQGLLFAISNGSINPAPSLLALFSRELNAQ